MKFSNLLKVSPFSSEYLHHIEIQGIRRFLPPDEDETYDRMAFSAAIDVIFISAFKELRTVFFAAANFSSRLFVADRLTILSQEIG